MWDFIKSFFVTVNYAAIDLFTSFYDEETDQLIPCPTLSYIVIGSYIDINAFVKSAEFEDDVAEVYCVLTNKEIRKAFFWDREFMKEAKKMFPDDDRFLAAFKLYIKKCYFLLDVDNASVINMTK